MPRSGPATAGGGVAESTAVGRSDGTERVGPRLRQARRARGLTLAAVAEEAGVTKGFLSLAERGRTRVSVPTLLRVCAALQIPLGSLFDYPEAVVVPSGAGAPLEMGGLNLQEYLLTPAQEAHVQVMQTVIAPGGGSGGAYTLDAKTVFAFVLRGHLDLIVGGNLRALDQGASTTFSAQVPHEWANTTAEETEVLWVIAPALPRDVVGDPARRTAASLAAQPRRQASGLSGGDPRGVTL